MNPMSRLMIGQMRVLMRDQQQEKATLQLRVGDIIKGKVIKLLPEGKALISLKGAHVVTRSQVSLSPGQEIFAKVQSLGSEIKLGLLSKQARVQAEFLRMLASHWQSGEPLGKLAEELAKSAAALRASNALSSKESSLIDRILALLGRGSGNDAETLAARLASLAKNLGLSYEASLARAVTLGTPILVLKRQLQKSLKPNLERLVSMVSQRLWEIQVGSDQTARSLLERLLSVCRSLEENVEFQQLANHFLQKQGAQLYMQLPLSFMGEQGLAELTIGSKGEGSKDGNIDLERRQVTLLLDLTGLGRVKAIASINAKKISCLIATQSSAVRDYIAERSGALVERLQAVGFEVAGIKSLVSREPLDRQLETFRELFVSDEPAFDVTA